MLEFVQEHRGIIVDLYGDGVLVFFDPHDGPTSAAAAQAVKCSLKMQGIMERFNRESKEKGLPELQTGIGIHVGQVVISGPVYETLDGRIKIRPDFFQKVPMRKK